MIDLETLATTADAVIMSIGAVKFNLDSPAIDPNGFYASVSVSSNLAQGRRISEDTLAWWLRQEPAAQAVFNEAKQPLDHALFALTEWMSDRDYSVWSNGADFDLPMLAHAFTQFDMAVPWKFWNSRCFRTYKNLPGAKGVKLPPVGVAHNALADAYSQAQSLQAIQAALFGGKPTVFTRKPKDLS